MKVSNAISNRVSKIIQKNQFVKDILKSIESKSGKVLLVGGAVRDLFLDLPIKDLDFEVYGLTLEQLEHVLQEFGVVSFIGKSFGVLRLHGLDIDWSLPRKDSSGRHPVVSYDPYMNYEQACIRRDLTINAMGIDMTTLELIDPFHGLQDLEDKILRAPDSDFFVQDPLRLLRVMQFVGRFVMRVDEELSQLCRTIDMSQVSSERIEQEFKKLLVQAKKPSVGLFWLIKVGKFNELLPGLQNHELLCEKLDVAAKLSYESDQEKLLIMWAIVCSFLGVSEKNNQFEQVMKAEKQPYINFMQRITHQQSLIKPLVSIVVFAPKLQQPITDVQMKWLAYWIAPDISIRCLLRFYGILYEQSVQELVVRAEQLGIVDQPEQPLLTGKDFLNVARGAKLGYLVKKSYQLQLDREVKDSVVLKKLVLD